MSQLVSLKRRRLIAYGVLATAAVLSSLFLTKNIDFRVYWYGGEAFIDGSRALYGHGSGLGYPMHYRYPPVTYLLLWPLSRLPLYWSGVLWMAGAWAAMAAAVTTAMRTVPMRIGADAALLATAYMFAYVVLAIRGGNVQPYVIAMILCALLLSGSHHLWAALLMAVAITFKVWPAFFLPWFFPRRRRAVLLWLVPLMTFVWLVPLVCWTPSEYLSLLQQWFHSELSTAISTTDLWHFPGQSLRGVLLRCLTIPSRWAAGFPDVHFLDLPPCVVVGLWLMVGTTLYGAICVRVLRCDERQRWIWDGLSFALFTLLQPFCPKSSMISMGPAALVAAALYCRTPISPSGRRETLARSLFVTASLFSLTGAVIQARPALRLLLTIGIDFYAAALLMVALLLWASPAPRNEDSPGKPTCVGSVHSGSSPVRTNRQSVFVIAAELVQTWRSPRLMHEQSATGRSQRADP